jgi:hypothetical protein
MMPTKRRRQTRALRPSSLSENALHYLQTGRRRPHDWDTFFDLSSEEQISRAWNAHREWILPQWIASRPGTRPWAWWECEAPLAAAPEKLRDRTWPIWRDRRARIGGIGDECWRGLAYAPSPYVGVEKHWVSEWAVRYYNGRARDVQGRPIGTEYSEGHFPCVAVDDDDPPVVESEPAYLKRHGLLMADEARRLDECAFEPVSIFDVLNQYDPDDAD